jgi:hypothetical protein
VLQAAELMPLPDDTPEDVAVVCGGKYGMLNVRSQKVLHNGVLMSASKFEVICGKGDAKKWKTSLWLVDEHGFQIVVGFLTFISLVPTLFLQAAKSLWAFSPFSPFCRLYSGRLPSHAGLLICLSVSRTPLPSTRMLTGFETALRVLPPFLSLASISVLPQSGRAHMLPCIPDPPSRGC